MTATQSHTQENPTGFVIDTLAVAAPRTHGIITAFDREGKPATIKNYDLTAHTPVPMPLDHAMQFLKDAAFVVTNEKGEVLKPLDVSAEKVTHVQLPEGCIIAKYEELTREALVLRAKVLPNSAHIHPIKTKVAEVIEFLKATAKANQRPAERGEMTAKELDELFKD